MTRMVMVVLLILGLGVATQASQEKSRTPPAAKASASAQVNLNTANVTQLETLPGIGKSTAERILEYREKRGGFKKIEELMNVQGVGEKSFLKLLAAPHRRGKARVVRAAALRSRRRKGTERVRSGVRVRSRALPPASAATRLFFGVRATPTRVPGSRMGCAARAARSLSGRRPLKAHRTGVGESCRESTAAPPRCRPGPDSPG